MFPFMKRFLGRHGGTAKQEAGIWAGKWTFRPGKIERTGTARTGSFHHMQVDHRCFDTGVSHEGLHGANVCARFKQVCGE